MRAVTWCGKNKVNIEDVAVPHIINPRDAIVKITSTAICGSDLHLVHGYVPTMHQGDILGHEFMGEVVDVGSEVRHSRVGDRIVVPFTIACGNCFFCRSNQWALCDNTNPNAWMVEDAYGHSPCGIFGYSHMLGGYAGGQAEYARVPFADVGPIKVPEFLSDEQVLFLSDIFPTGYQAAEQCNIQSGDTIAVWGCGPVGQFAIRSAFMLGAARVIAIDHYSNRLDMAADAGAVPLNFDDDEGVYEQVLEITGGMGPDACIDAVGLEAHGMSLDAIYDRVKVAMYMATDRAHVLRQIIRVCRKGGTVSIAGVYGGVLDKLPFGAAFNKGLTFKMGQTHVIKYLRPLLEKISHGDIDPRFVITHRIPLENAPEAYEMFGEEQNECIKVVLKP